MNINEYSNNIDSIDLKITNHIKNNDINNDILKNPFLLTFKNFDNKNSIDILIDKENIKSIKKIIKNPINLLLKSSDETLLITNMLKIPKLHKDIIKILKNLNDSYVIHKILLHRNKKNQTFTMKLINLIAKNQSHFNNDLIIILTLINSIINKFDSDIDQYVLVTALLAREINDDDYLLSIYKKLNINNIDIFPDEFNFSVIDYLIEYQKFKSLNYLIDKVNDIYFVNFDYNTLFNLIDDMKVYDVTIINLLFKIFKKSNIYKIKDKYNNTILHKIINKFDISYDIIKPIINNFNLNDPNIDNVTLNNLIYKKYNIELPIKKIKYDFTKITKILNYTPIGTFNSDNLHNVIYTTIIKNKYNNFYIPFVLNNNIDNDIFKLSWSNNNSAYKHIIMYYLKYFNGLLPHLVLFQNKYNFYIHPELITFIKNHTDKQYIYIKLRLDITNPLSNEEFIHANLILIDHKRKLVERFEPYGEIYYTESNYINKMIIENIANPLNYKFKFIQPYPGFQIKSDETNVKSYGDPAGFCMAWCFMYLEIRLLYEDLNGDECLELINYYINYIFKKDAKYMTFIRYYAKHLDEEKNKILIKCNMNLSEIYQDKYTDKYIDKIISNIMKYY